MNELPTITPVDFPAFRKRLLKGNAAIKQISEHWYRYGDSGYFAIDHQGNGVLLKNMFVKPESRGQGLGTKILQAVQGTADGQQAFLFCFPVPFVYLKPIEEIDLEDCREGRDMISDAFAPIPKEYQDQIPLDMHGLSEYYLRNGFIRYPQFEAEMPMTDYSRSAQRPLLIYFPKDTK